MGTTLRASFETRREAEMTVERLVQEHEIDRAAITVAAAGDEPSAGTKRAGSDNDAGDPSPEERDDTPLNGAVTVSVAIDDADKAGKIRDAFTEFAATDVDRAG